MAIRQGFVHAVPLDSFISDTEELIHPIDAIYVGGTGNIALSTTSGLSVTFTAVPVGTILPVRAKQIFTTGTSATFLIGMWGN